MKKCGICGKSFTPLTNDKYCSTKCSYKVMSMKKYSKHYKASSGEWIPHKAKMEWQCCDCGLVHNVWFRIGREGFLEVKMTRNQQKTSKKRDELMNKAVNNYLEGLLLVRKNKSSK